MVNSLDESISLEFENLPLVEVSVRATIEPELSLDLKSIGLIHEQIKESFPEIRTIDRIEVAPGTDRSVSFELGQIPAFVVGGPNGLSITIQTNLLLVRWVRQPGENHEYPRYKALQNALWNTLAACRKSTVAPSVKISVMNMCYVNFIQTHDFAGVVTRYFSKQAQVGVTADARRVRLFEVAWEDERGIDLRFRLEPVKKSLAGEPLSGFVLSTIAGMRFQDEEPDVVLDRLHARLQRFFPELISEQAKTEWKLKE